MRRTILTRRLADGGNTVVLILCNPNTADEVINDHTTTKCSNYFKELGFSFITILNLFTERSVHPTCLKGSSDPVGLTDFSILKAADLIVYGWGKIPSFLKKYYAWIAQEPEMFESLASPMCFGVNLDGSPSHPARIVLKLVPFRQSSLEAIERERSEKRFYAEVKRFLKLGLTLPLQH